MNDELESIRPIASAIAIDYEISSRSYASRMEYEYQQMYPETPLNIESCYITIQKPQQVTSKINWKEEGF